MIAFVVGTRPESIKLAPLIVKIAREERVVIYTGQHYDRVLTRDVWETLPPYEFDLTLTICGVALNSTMSASP